MKQATQNRWLRIAAFVSMMALLTVPFAGTVAAEDAAAPSESKVTYAELLDERRGDDYAAYCEQHGTENSPLISATVSAEQLQKDDTTVLSENGIHVVEDTEVTGVFTVEQAGWYSFSLTYTYADAKEIINALVKVTVNGKVPFSEAGAVSLPRLWKNGEIEVDKGGNDRLPEQVQILREITSELPNETGRTRSLRFWLEAGENQIGLSFTRGTLYLKSLRLFNEATPNYADYSTSQKPAAGEGLTFQQQYQAENAVEKNDSSLVPAKDRTGPATVPSDPVHGKLNMVSGSNWNKPGQTLTFHVTVPEDGYYRIGMRCKQDTLEGLSVYRRLTVDGVSPFKEADSWGVAYANEWAYHELGGDSAMLVYLTGGVQHTISLEVVNGESGELGTALEDIVYVLNYLYRKMLVITGTDPDTNRDYFLTTEIPELIPLFTESAEKLDEVLKLSQEMAGQKGGQMSVLGQIRDQLKDFVEDPGTIPTRMASYKSNVSSLASLVLSLQSQPLSMDYLVVSGANAPTPKVNASFWQSLVYHIKAFFGTFASDYNVMPEEHEGENSVVAWVSGGREQADILQQMIDEDFTPEHNISVNLKLVTVSLSQAILAGTAPDLMLGVSRGQPVNLAARGVLEPIEDMDGFEEITSWFTKDAFVPYSYDGHVYGVPVSMDFQVMFYRTDILEELGISVPQTWDDLYEIIPILQHNNMTVGLPYSTITTAASIDAGMGSRDVFSALLMQRGGTYYTDDNLASLNGEAAREAFKEWTEFYNYYGLDLTYDFYNRFRVGEMPIGIQNYSVYNQLSSTAPEIKGLWDFTLIPGTRKSDGTIDRTEAASGSAAVIVKGTKHAEEAWELMKWWVSADTQFDFGMKIETLMGTASRSTTANIEAIKRLPWSEEQSSKLLEQMNWIKEIPEVVGGYYYSRGLDNAFRNTVIGIIATLMWTPTYYLAEGQSLTDFFNSRDTEGYQKLLVYIGTIVNRYKHSPAIWGWEIGNELSLQTQSGESIAALAGFYADVAAYIRKTDGTKRLITNGNSQMRPAQYNAMIGGSASADTLEQQQKLSEVWANCNIDITSIHVYNQTQSLNAQTVSIKDYLAQMVQFSKNIGAPLFIGEYCDDELNRVTHTEQVLKDSLKKFDVLHEAVISNDIQLAALWIYSNYSVTHDPYIYYKTDYQYRDYYNYMMEKARTANRDFVAKGKQDTATYWNSMKNTIA